MEIITASKEIRLLVALGFGIISVWETVANACTPVRSALPVLVVRSSYPFDISVR